MVGWMMALSLLAASPGIEREAEMTQSIEAMRHATGEFDVKMTPVEPGADAPVGGPGRMILAKTFRGGLEATGAGEMLGVLNAERSGAYVALERVNGTLDGRPGGFMLVHRGIMDRGAQDLSITIVPGSGDGELVGISGVFHLKIEDGRHLYDLAYHLEGE
ncbi:DUF3224 domain-containing protein [uncultured Brevundimonas sp.]|uniref:DUF3224 domain-containing protein n=1 Tax=uncultured Brevundimonas sp. TaxID=213418 RepID=UPI0025CE6B3D|nr:DUF3224 domain-containing protein [uncultured Brevundimonas sp.]